MNTEIKEIKNELKKEVASAIKIALKKEMMKFRSEIIKYISDEEMRDIKKLYKKPSKTVRRTVKISS